LKKLKEACPFSVNSNGEPLGQTLSSIYPEFYDRSQTRNDAGDRHKNYR